MQARTHTHKHTQTHTHIPAWVVLLPWQPVIDPLSYAVREGILMTGSKQRRGMERDGAVGEKAANIHTQSLRLIYRRIRENSRIIFVWPTHTAALHPPCLLLLLIALMTVSC